MKLFCLCFLLQMPCCYTGSHSLWAFSTLILGDTPFPEFSTVVMLDDIQLGYYDSVVQKLIYRQHKSEYEDDEQTDASLIFGRQHNSMLKRALFSKHQLNSTQGVHVQQRLAGCELLDQDIPGPLRSWDAFNTINDEELNFYMQQKTLQSNGAWPNLWSHVKKESTELMYANVYSPICIRILKRYLHLRKNEIMRKVKPRVRLLQRTLPDSGEAKVTCLATGFYPRYINLTLLRDGQPVSDHQITGGELLPNGDETYQMRKILEVSAEELQHHHYTCTAEHLCLDNKLDIRLDLEPGVGMYVVIPVVVLGVALLCVGGVIIMWRRRHNADPPLMCQPKKQMKKQMKRCNISLKNLRRGGCDIESDLRPKVRNH
ncbi:major histocompatibility complex class I-related protein 1-like [Alosa pseudoharengus]|uniref:major histocompatibility complex class I-related protein 1-like n=1 Tax=Alosa pseudoharengus TaxID=34774 RepID=UPI003F892314